MCGVERTQFRFSPPRKFSSSSFFVVSFFDLNLIDWLIFFFLQIIIIFFYRAVYRLQYAPDEEVYRFCRLNRPVRSLENPGRILEESWKNPEWVSRERESPREPFRNNRVGSFDQHLKGFSYERWKHFRWGGRHAERNSFKDKLLQDSEAIIKELRWY